MRKYRYIASFREEDSGRGAGITNIFATNIKKAKEFADEIAKEKDCICNTIVSYNNFYNQIVEDAVYEFIAKNDFFRWH